MVGLEAYGDELKKQFILESSGDILKKYHIGLYLLHQEYDKKFFSEHAYRAECE